jgi:hypothetical protein
MMNELVHAKLRVNLHAPKEETIFEAVLAIVAAAWCGFLYYLIAWLLTT